MENDASLGSNRISFTMYLMRNHITSNRSVNFKILLIILTILFLVACQANTALPVPITNPAATPQASVDTLNTAPALPTPTPILTPPVLPGLYQSEFLNPLDVPRTYIQDTCQYLRNKWNPANAQPGTVVMIIMIQGIFRGMVEETGGITAADFGRIMEELHKQNFVAINTEQFLAFMERNIKIPQRSVLIIQDNRRHGENFDRHFRGYWYEWGWPVVNGWQSQPDTSESVWQENIALENEGWVDHQAQGVMVGTFLSDDTSKAIITRELEGSINAFADRFGKTPIAFIWPGGGFGLRPVQAARQLGYQLGFTSNSRGPVMYNWVPLASEIDASRPVFIPEAQIGDPLMTLPRYWPSQIYAAIDEVRIMGNEAAEYTQKNKEIELEYYNIVCIPTHGQIPAP